MKKLNESIKFNDNYYQRYFQQQKNDTQKENCALLTSIILFIASCFISNIFLPILGILLSLYWIFFVKVANKLKRIILRKIIIYDQLWNREAPKLFNRYGFYHVRLFLPICIIILYLMMIIIKITNFI